MPNQTNVTNYAVVKPNIGKSPEEAMPTDKVIDQFNAVPKAGISPTPGSGQFFGVLSTTTRAQGKKAWDGGSGTNKVVDFTDAPFAKNKSFLQKNP